MKSTDTGRLGEREAAKYLRKKGYKILEKNLHCSHNEIDIVAIDKEYGDLVFVEVKARSFVAGAKNNVGLSKSNGIYDAAGSAALQSKYGAPASAVTFAKQSRLISAARQFLASRDDLEGFQPRFDVIEIYLDKDTAELLKINHIENAFTA